MLNSLGEKLVSYVSPSSEGGPEGTEPAEQHIKYSDGGNCKRLIEPVDIEEYSPVAKRQKINKVGFVSVVTNSVVKMAEWFVHGKNYLLGRWEMPSHGDQLHSKDPLREAYPAEQFLQQTTMLGGNGNKTAPSHSKPTEIEHLQDEVNIVNPKLCPKSISRLKDTHPIAKTLPPTLVQKHLHRPPINETEGRSQEMRKASHVNGNHSSKPFLFSSSSQIQSRQLNNGSSGGSSTRVFCTPGFKRVVSPMVLTRNKLYSVPQKPIQRNDIYNIVLRQHMHTAEQCFRLDEKERYRQLLQQYCIRYPSLTKNLNKAKDTVTLAPKLSTCRKSVESQHAYTFKDLVEFTSPDEVSVPKIETPEGSLKDDDSKEPSLSDMPTPRQYISFPDIESPENSRQTDFEEESSASDEKSTSEKKSIKDPTETSCLRHLTSSKNTQIFADDWLNELISKYSASTREQKRKIEEQQLRAKFLEEERRSQDDKLHEKIQQQLKIVEKEPPVILETELEPETPALPEITDSMKSIIEDASEMYPSEEVLVEGFRIHIKRQDMSTLSGLSWLNDEVINFYMSMLMERSKKSGQSKVYSFNTFFYPKLLTSGYEGVRRWTRKVDVFSVKHLLIPIHLGMHWCLTVVNFSDRTICYYDSMGGKNQQCLETIKTYLCDESLDKRKRPFNMVGWTSKTIKNIPQQMNGSDCGMFACKYADYITRELKISFTQADMPVFRRLMIYEILKKQLLT